VAADDGVKPQTEEVIQIIKAAKLPYVVAINKIDKPGADIQRVKSELSSRGVIGEDWGGEVPMIEISAKGKVNIDKLLDVLLLVADVNAETIKADPAVPAVGTIIESHMDKNIGPVSTILVQAGTLHKNDTLVVNGSIYGKVRAMKDYRGKMLSEAGPSTPVQIVGFKVPPEVGDILDVGGEASAEKIDVRKAKNIQTGAQKPVLAVMSTEEDDGKKKTLNVVIKADVLGSLEAIIGLLEKIKHDEVGVKIIGKGPIIASRDPSTSALITTLRVFFLPSSSSVLMTASTGFCAPV
jgi:translation initiation factor IF-2